MRNISAAIQAEKNKESIIPIELYQVYLDDITLYLATWTHEIDFFDEAGYQVIYEPAALSRRPIKRSNTLEVDRFSVSLDNVGQDWSGVVANYNLQGAKVNVWKVFLERVGDNYQVIGEFEDRVPLFSGEIDSPQLNQNQITVEVVSKLNVLDKTAPARRFSGRCPWIFGGEECGIDAPTASGTIQNIDETGRVISLEYYPPSNWVHGSFKVGKYKRIITDYSVLFKEITIEFPLPTDVSIGDYYSMKAGCSKVKEDAEEGCKAWNNREFFGGFPAIPKVRNIRE